MAAAWGLGEGRMGGYCLMGSEVLFYKMKSHMGMDVGEGCTTNVNVLHLIPLNCTLTNN